MSLFLIFAFLIFSAFKDCLESDQGFSKTSFHPYTLKWEGRALEDNEKMILRQALFQKYTYLNSGVQSAAFLSEDGKYVIKFFKQKPFLPNTKATHIPFFSKWHQTKKQNKCDLKRDKIFSAYKISFDLLSQETGVVYVHFNPTNLNLPVICFTDASGKSSFIALNDYDFIVERRATSLCNYLDALLEQGEIQKAGEAIDKLLNLTRILYEKGQRNRDIEFVNNYGFIDDAPVLFDVGRLLPCIGQDGHDKYQKKLLAFLPAFRAWINAFYPMLIPFCNASIAKIGVNDALGFSLSAWHPFQLKWEGHPLNDEEKKIIDEALCQNYHFLNMGGQSVVFSSEDNQFVIKFFKQKIFSLLQKKTFNIPFFSTWQSDRKIRQREAKRDRIFSAYQLGFDRLSKETGIFYVHFNSTDTLKKMLLIKDASGKSFSIHLDNYDFVLERRAVPLKNYLDQFISQGKIECAGLALQSVIQLFDRFYQKKIRNRDGNIVNNYGFVNGNPVLFDVGRLISCEGEKAKRKYQKRIKKILSSFHNWIHSHYPQLIPYCDAEIDRIMPKEACDDILPHEKSGT